jgi:hypothetical protein
MIKSMLEMKKRREWRTMIVENVAKKQLTKSFFAFRFRFLSLSSFFSFPFNESIPSILNYKKKITFLDSLKKMMYLTYNPDISLF